MTREMNKLDWCNYEGECNWWVAFDGECCKRCKDYKLKQRILNPDIAEFFWNCCKMEKLK